MQKKKYLRLTITSMMLLGSAAIVFANNPAPPVNQLLGIRDATFSTFTEMQCRGCHSKAANPTFIKDRHHLRNEQPVADPTDIPYSNYGGVYDCYSCHEFVWSYETYTYVLKTFHDCLYCHVKEPDQATVHHRSMPAKARNCKACHGPINNPDDGHYIPTYGGSIVTPKPKQGLHLNGSGACDFCHNAGIDLASGEMISTNKDTHHGTGVVAGPFVNSPDPTSACNLCHPNETQLTIPIRACENCHGVQTLHNIQADANGDGVIKPRGEAPFAGHIGNQQDCDGCHGMTSSSSLDAINPSSAIIQNINSLSQSSVHKGIATIVDINGSAITNTDTTELGEITINSVVKLTRKTANGGEQDMYFASQAITPEKLTIGIPTYLQEGNYLLRLIKHDQVSNPLPLNILPTMTVESVNCETLNDESIITVVGKGFGVNNQGVGIEGSEITVSNDLGPCVINNWSDMQIVASSQNGCGTAVTVTNLFGSTTSAINASPLAKCITCHEDRTDKVSCRNKAWRFHLRMNRVDKGTYELAEKTYLGNLCSIPTVNPKTIH